MIYKDVFDRLLDELASAIGMETLKFDDDGFCHITVDNEFPVSIRREHATQRLVILGQIAERLPGTVGQELLTAMLAQGLGPLRDNGIGIGYETSTENLILYRSIPLADLDLERFQATLGNFFETVKGWRQRLQTAQQSPGSAIETRRSDEIQIPSSRLL
ncbi:CesT family type III secretion system chaperone [Paraburkholderia sediminicola]|uniref:CesT family type III secretion system chaperone n=1 Tax=Paraburkholderia sediminicola TaxID=458836 RepID=UPI0038BBBC69